jgi:hypothetical protein
VQNLAAKLYPIKNAAAGIHKRINKPLAGMQSVPAQFKFALYGVRLAALDRATVAVPEGFVFVAKPPTIHVPSCVHRHDSIICCACRASILLT